MPWKLVVYVANPAKHRWISKDVDLAEVGGGFLPSYGWLLPVYYARVILRAEGQSNRNLDEVIIKVAAHLA